MEVGNFGTEVFLHVIALRDPHLEESYVCMAWGRCAGWLVVHINWVVATQIIFLIFIPKIGEDEPKLTSIFFRWVGSTTNQLRMK